jgi:regulator of RNase E activity RraA
LAGFIVDGLVRDATVLLDIGLPVICRGLLPVGPLKLPADLKGIGQRDVEVNVGEAVVKPGDWAFGDADGIIFIAAEHLPAVYEWADRSWEREEALTERIQAGEALGDLLDVEAFLTKRAEDPAADFNAHLAEQGHAI